MVFKKLRAADGVAALAATMFAMCCCCSITTRLPPCSARNRSKIFRRTCCVFLARSLNAIEAKYAATNAATVPGLLRLAPACSGLLRLAPARSDIEARRIARWDCRWVLRRNEFQKLQ